MLELKNISFQVADEKDEKGILDDVSFTLDDNKFIVITGPNGGGKSTLARVIAGIEKPTSGRIFWDGEDITDMSITDRARLGISYAFQQPVRFKGHSPGSDPSGGRRTAFCGRRLQISVRSGTVRQGLY